MTSGSRLDIGVSSRAGVTIVTLTGFLDLSTAPKVRNALLKCVADQPVAVIADLATALGAANQPPARRITRLRLAPLPHSPATARRVVAATCECWDCSELVEDATAVASELVANAVRHAGTDAELRLELRRHLLTVAITDGSASAPALQPSEGDPEPGGFGLRIVDSLSRAWGWAPTSNGGKIVWAVLTNRPSPLLASR